jgi:hypothetical protein
MKSLSELLSNTAYLGAMLAALVVGGFILIRVIRSRMHNGGDTESFTLNDLRGLRASGQLTDAEYERMRAMLIGSRPATSDARGAARDEDEDSQ